MERVYSARLRRWNIRRPGFGCTAAAVSMRVSSATASVFNASASGRRAPGGGIMPVRSLRITFSATGAWSTASATSNATRESPPALPRSL